MIRTITSKEPKIMPRTITPGRWRGLKASSRIGDGFSILAIDQRGSYRKMLPEGTSREDACTVKNEITAVLSRHTSAVLLDCTYGYQSALELANPSGLLFSVEKSGYTGEDTYRRTDFDPRWNASKIKSFGASAAKLMVYYNPRITELARELESMIADFIRRAHALDLPVFLEPMSYSADSAVPKSSPAFAAERPGIVVETARRLSALKPDVLKMEFPIDMLHGDTNEDHWVTCCRRITEASTVPWVLLSAGVDFPDFERQLTAALEAGASGYLAGRAIWKEAVLMNRDERAAFLHEQAAERAERLNRLVDAHAVPWTRYYTYADAGPEWFQDYMKP